MTKPLTRAEIYEHLARLEREGHPRPWETFEYWNGHLWQSPSSLLVLLDRSDTRHEIRLKPQLPPMVERTIRHPEPVREKPPVGYKIYIVNPLDGNYTVSARWNGVGFQSDCLNRGRIHLTERNAKAHGMAEAGCSWEDIEQVLRGEE